MIKRKIKELVLPRDTKILVHIGKCGGSTIRNAVARSEVGQGMRITHITKPPVSRRFKYYIVARSPISRAVSAFNWRYRLVVIRGNQEARFPGEHEVLTRYKTMNDLALSLYAPDGTPNLRAHKDIRKIHHLKEDIAFYLADLLKVIGSEQVEAVMMQENLNADIERVFGYSNTEILKGNAAATDPQKRLLDEAALRNLRRFFAKDFECLTTLYCWNKIEKETFLKIFDAQNG